MFSEKLSADRKISGAPVHLQYVKDVEEQRRKLKTAATIRDIPAQWYEKARAMILELLEADVIERADEEVMYCSR